MKTIQKEEISESSLFALAEKLVGFAGELLKSSRNEEELKIGFEKILAPILKELSISSSPKYDRTIITGRPDAVHGQVIIEYEPPYAFRKEMGIETAYRQLLDYIEGETRGTKETLFLFASKFVGVGFDGEQIFFVRFKGDKNKAKLKFNQKDFTKIGPYPFSSQTAKTLLIHLRGLARLPLTAENLADKFGSQSQLAPKVVSALADALENWDDTRKAHIFFNEWKRLFGIVYGEQFTSYQEGETETLSKMYKVGKETGFQELLFSVHTYFAFLMKLIVAELLTLKETKFNSSFNSELTNVPEDELKKELFNIEEGGVYARRGITNFLEGDFFRWYLDAWSPRLKDAIQEITRSLSEFEPATSTIEPEATRDLLKKLYQYLVPREVRHRLGEYYTPDWLAGLVLNEVDYNGDTRKRLLDPACGSGTFLVLAIQQAKEYGRKENWSQLEIAKRIVENIWGFDLNPLAVIAARTNYLFALGDLIDKLSHVEIPIYLADSVLWPEQVDGQKELNFSGGNNVKIKTSVKEFHVPYIWVENKGLRMQEAAPMVEKFAKDNFEPEVAMKHFKEKGLVFPPFEKVVRNFYREILDLETENKNGIWARFLKNAFAPMVAGKFDFVVGNPPWIRWRFLSKEYREATLPLWKEYGLFSLKGHQAGLGGGEKDFSMLFVYASSDYYLKDGAKLGFLITQEIFKAKGAGEGFRKFQIGEKDEYLKILRAHDLVSIKPFEGAANKTAAIILQKNKKTEYPIPYIVWTKKKGVGKIETDKLFNEILPLLEKKYYYAKPIGSKISAWQTFSGGEEISDSLKGTNAYRAYAGAMIEPYGVFWLKIEEVLSDGNLLIRNLPEKGKRKIESVKELIEPDLVFPAIRGSDIERWGVGSEIFVLVPQNPKTREPFSEREVKTNWPRIYSYLTKFKNILASRAGRTVQRLAEKTSFYAIFGVGSYTMSTYKTVWKIQTTDIVSGVISEVKTLFGYKMGMPLNTTAFFSTNNETEAHYLCAIINSKLVRDFIKSFSSAGRGFGTPSVMEHVGIPKFDPKDSFHQKLADISKKCHQLKSEEKEVVELEKENEELVRRLFDVTK